MYFMSDYHKWGISSSTIFNNKSNIYSSIPSRQSCDFCP